MPVRLTLLAVGLLAQAASTLQQKPPTIRSGVELVMVDVQVTSRDGTPITGLKPEQFEVMIDGSRRPVATLSLVQHTTTDAAQTRTKQAPRAAPASAESTVVAEARTIIIGVDQASFQIVNEPAAREAVTRLLAMAAPEDEIGMVGYPGPGPRVAPTRDRQAILTALTRINGQLQVPRPRLNISLAEAVDITAKDVFTIAQVQKRECASGCHSNTIAQVAQEIASTYERAAARSINGLHSLVEAVKEYPGRKTLVLVSAGFASTDRIGGRPDVRFEADMLGLRAAEANAAIYALHMDVNFLTAFSAANAGQGAHTAARNGGILELGLDRFTGSAGGTLITVHASPDAALKRLLRETSAYYLLGVESLPEHRNGKVHRIAVKVNQRGAQVRSRNAVFIPRAQ